MSDSIRNKVIWRLTNGRKLSDGEIRELDALQIALDLDANDPFWGQVAWVWATTPRKTDFDNAVQSISDKIKALNHGITDALDLSATFKEDGGLKEINQKLNDLVSRPIHEAFPGDMRINESVLRKAFAAAIRDHDDSHGQIDFVRQFKDAVIEGVSWVWVTLAGTGFALALVFGYVVGEAIQRHADDVRIHALQGQVNALTAAVSGQSR